ncbi:HD-GYP domain-containing protein [Halalkalibacter urbisdiaboli]|uniref:HD-GYP domain-containing protein n=1 Tax=Halalkalibacter urbisdiaboli TaxID=1960589 RepID=UPI000B43D2CF|nr:HD-GYP domain-containing protein [Halalkalibacter urbisdiaboli]
MKVKPQQLVEGCILAEDIFSSTDFPILKEKTVLSKEHLTILDVFLVPAVEVESFLVDGEKFVPVEMGEDGIQEEEVKVKEDSTLLDYYMEAVKQYKKLFQSWQAGKRVEMIEVRNCLLPLFERVIEHPRDLLTLHHYSTAKDYIYNHSVSVGALAAFLGNKLNYEKGEWMQIGFGGALADAGMAKLSPKILEKNGPLTASEFEEMKKHPIHSYKMLKGITGVTDSVLLAVLQHHERHDGSGYPLGTDSQKMHIFSQVVAVADVYHAMTSERHYRSKRSPYQVLEEISKEEFGKFDHRIVQTLLDSLIKISVGSKVRLTTGEEAEIVFFDNLSPTRPMVKLKKSGDIIHLAQQPDIHIEDIIS